MKLSDMGVRPRLFIGFGVLLVLLAVELACTIAWFRRLDVLREALAEDVGPRSEAAARLERAVLYRAVSIRDFRRTRDPKYLRAEEDAFEDARTALRDIDALARRPEGRAIVNEMKPVAAMYATASRRLVESVKSGSSAEESAEVGAEALAAREKLLAVARRFSVYQRQKLTHLNASIDAVQRTMSWGLPCLGLLMLGTILGTGLVVAGAVAGPLRELQAAARSLARGDYRRALALDPAAHSATAESDRAEQNEFREFAHAFAYAAGKLQQREAALAADVQLSGIFATRLAVNELADNALRAIAMLAHAEVGAMYVLDERTSILQRAASFPLDVHAPTFAVGDGIPGQAALLKSPIHIRNIPEDTPFRVRLGVDDLPPRGVLAVPILLRGRVHGVIVLASLRDFTEEGIRFVQHAANLLAPSLANAISHREVVRMRSALQETNEQLGSQNAELRSQREQIQEQKEELQAQQEEIQAQNEELKTQNEELQAQRDELHAQGEALREAVQASEAANRQKNEFLATLAHELRNPIAAIHHAIQSLEARAPEAFGKPVGIISRQARRLGRLTDDLLDVSRIAHGKLVLAKAPVDMAKVVREAVESSRSAIAARGHELLVSVGEGAHTVEGDPARLEQTVCNLLENAAKFTAPGGKVWATLDSEGDRVVLRVKDTGIGIDRDLLPRVFEKYAQGEPPLPGRGGLGIGLSLVRGLVELHGGGVQAFSEGPDRGSEFVVSIPKARERTPPASRPPGRAVGAGATPGSLRVVGADEEPDDVA